MNGILLINKPIDFTSRDVVNKLTKILKTKKIGHTGTLDPIATGVLVVCVGNTTKLCELLTSEYKEYEATIKLGIKTDTLDTTGNIIEKKEYNVNEEQIKDVLNSFLGTSIQTTPIYSAVKVNGKKLYEYAREGIEVEVEPRDIELYKLNLLSIENDEIEFEVSCSKGTYIRVVCEDIAKTLGTIGTMSSLNRTIVDKFNISQAITFEELEIIKENVDVRLIKMEDVFDHLPKLTLNKRKEDLFLNGVMLTFELDDGVYNIYNSNRVYLGTGTIKNDLLKRDIII